MSEQRYNGTIVSGRKDGKLANSDNIYDKDRKKMQSDINKEMKTRTDNSFDSLKQTKQSAEDGGENIITITRHDGLSEQVKFYNGSKGSKGDRGEKGEKGDKGEAGMQGNSGVADASNKTLVNDAITGGETDFLSAEVGKLGILTYDCSKGGTVTHATLQDAINSVPTTFQKVGLTITYKSGNTIYRYTLNSNTWSTDTNKWYSVEDKLSTLSTNEGISDIDLTSNDAQELDYCLDSSGILGRKFKSNFIPVRINQDRDAQNGIVLDRQKILITAVGYAYELYTKAVKRIFGESKIYANVGDISYPSTQTDKPFVLIRFLAENGSTISQTFVYANSYEEIDIPSNAYLLETACYLSISGAVRKGEYVFNKVFITTDYLNRYLNEKILQKSEDVQTLSEDIQALPNIGRVFFDDDDVVYVGKGTKYDAVFVTEIPASKKYGKFHIKIGNVEIPDKGIQEEVCVVYREKNSKEAVITNTLYYQGDDVIITPNTNTSKISLIVYVSTANKSVKNETYKIHNLTISYEGKYNVLALKNNQDTTKDWEKATLATYGDSITAICNGDFSSPFNVSNSQNWANRVANYYNMSKQLGRGIGSQGFMWNDKGGAICFINAGTGTLIERMQNYNYETWMALEEKDFYDSVRNIDLSSKVSKEQIDNGVIIPIRGCFCSWLRIKTMFPKSIKDGVNLIFIMGGTNDTHEDTKATWVPNDETDPEWKNSEYYSTYGGDYNISTIKGGIASTIMKMQAWMPNAIIILGTNLNGRSADKTLSVDETNKAKDMIEVAQLLGIPCIDVFGTAGINGLNSQRFITDGIHPYSVLGSKYLARSIIGGLKSIIPNL